MLEQLLEQADGLHREAALLSNTLHQYPTEDLEGVQPVIAQIRAKRGEWKEVVKRANFVKQTGKLPEMVVEQPSAGPAPAGVAELKLELQRVGVNISKATKKIADRPDHKKSRQWSADLDKLNALKSELKEQIVNLTYATT